MRTPDSFVAWTRSGFSSSAAPGQKDTEGVGVRRAGGLPERRNGRFGRGEGLAGGRGPGRDGCAKASASSRFGVRTNQESAGARS
jgi:hypothetical protein